MRKPTQPSRNGKSAHTSQRPTTRTSRLKPGDSHAQRGQRSPEPSPSAATPAKKQAPGTARKPLFRTTESPVISKARRYGQQARRGSAQPATKGSVSRSAALISVFIVVLLFVVTVVPPLYTWYQEKQNYRDVHAQLLAAKHENAELKKQLQRWNDPDYINLEARQRLGFVKPGDVQYNVEGLPPKQVAASTTTPPRPWFMIVTDSVAAAGQGKRLDNNGTPGRTEIGVPAEGATINPDKKQNSGQ